MKEQPTEGATLGKYRILGTLGRGSMGVVYKAEDPAIGRIVAIKTLRKIGPSKFQDAESALERFRTEARSAGKLRHPNIITIFDASINDDTPFIVMDYVEGKSLESVVHAAGRLEPKRALRMLKQLAEALDEAHKHGVIHRDIKPSNVVVDSQDRPYILDFGVAKLNETIQEEVADKPKEPVMGTPAYMSPEQILNRSLSHRSDLFSFALVCFEVLSGSRPFPGETFNEVVNSILHSSPIPITSLVPDFPLQLEVEFEHALAKRPEDRPDSALEVIRVFSKAMQGSSGVGTASSASGMVGGRARKASEWRSIGTAEPGAGSAAQDVRVASQEGVHSSTSVGEEGPSEDVVTRPQSPDSAPLGKGELIALDKKGYPQGRNPIGQADPIYSNPGASPGDVFRHEEDILGPSIGFQRQFSLARAGFLIFALVAFAGSAFLLFSVLKGEDPRDILGLRAKPKTEVPTNGTVGPDRVSILDKQSGQIDDRTLPKVNTKAVESTSLSELADRQVLAVVLAEQTALPRRLEALQETRIRRLPELVQVCSKLLSHESYVIRIESAKSLGEAGNREAAPILLDHLSDYDPLVRVEIARAIGKLGSSRSVGYLKTFHAGEENEKVKAEIQATIEKITGLPLRSAH